MSMEYVEPVVSIANCLGTPVCKYLRYHRKLNDYVRNFKMIRDELNCIMEDIQLQLKAELLHPVGKTPKKGVENWLQKVKALITEAHDVENKVSNGRYFCRAWNGKLVDEKTQEMQKFIDKAPDAAQSLGIDGPSVGLPLPTSELVGEKAVRAEIWQCLMQEEVSKIGVWGMGGVGKTTIMKHIHNDILNQRLAFERVIWVTISKEFNVMKLQDDIAFELKGELPKGRDKLTRAKILSEMLRKEGKYVLILDDVWDKFSMEEVGIPEPSSRNGCKLVLTTRKEEVCRYMGCKVVTVKPLSEEEALILFLNKVGPNIVRSETLMPTLRLVVKECAGLPLTIVVVAGTLKGDDDPRFWKNALKELKDRIGKVEGVEAEVIECLKFSYNNLKDEKVKHCFLYCALYPEDFNIEKDELIECWIDDGLIDEMDTREEMKDEGYAILKKFEDNCLLEKVTSWNDLPHVKMHDAVREMALSITSLNPRYMIRAGLQLEELPKERECKADVEKVSFMRNRISEIPMEKLPPKCPLLKTLLLQENFIRMIPNPLFANMPSLSVLNLSDTSIECLPSSVSELKSLTALLLCRCYELRYLPSLSKLEGLKKLDLEGTKIEEVPEGMNMLINLRYLDLRVNALKGIPIGILPKLSFLQHLKLQTFVKAEEVVALEKLEFFCGRFEVMNELYKFVSSMLQQPKKDLTKYWLTVGSDFVSLGRDNKTVAINGVIFFEGDELSMLPADMKELNILNCSGIEYVVSFSSFSSSSTTHLWTQSLECLFLYNLQNLSEVIKVEGMAPSDTFSHLKRIIIQDCNGMKTLLPQCLLHNLLNLDEMWVESCKQVVEIFGAAPTVEHEEKEIADALIKFNLPKLRVLRFWELPELESICSSNGVMVCDSLRSILFEGCDKLKRIPPFVGNGNGQQPYANPPPSFKIWSSMEWWESLEWDDHPNIKNLLQPHWRPLT